MSDTEVSDTDQHRTRKQSDARYEGESRHRSRTSSRADRNEAHHGSRSRASSRAEHSDDRHYRPRVSSRADREDGHHHRERGPSRSSKREGSPVAHSHNRPRGSSRASPSRREYHSPTKEKHSPSRHERSSPSRHEHYSPSKHERHSPGREKTSPKQGNRSPKQDHHHHTSSPHKDRPPLHEKSSSSPTKEPMKEPRQSHRVRASTRVSHAGGRPSQQYSPSRISIATRIRVKSEAMPNSPTRKSSIFRRSMAYTSDPLLPRITKTDLILNGTLKDKCGGMLKKKPTTSSWFSRSKMLLRFYYINLKIEDYENYKLYYGYTEVDDVIRRSYSLEGATVKPLDGLQFQIDFSNDTTLILQAASDRGKRRWVSFLEHAIKIVSQRSHYLKHMIHPSDATANHDIEENELSIKYDKDVYKLPIIRMKDIRLPTQQDESTKTLICGGSLHKKAGKSSLFFRGQMQERYFFIRLDLGETDNYTLEYSYNMKNLTSRCKYPLENAKMIRLDGYMFQINTILGQHCILEAHTRSIRDRWVKTLFKVIKVASIRAKFRKDPISPHQVHYTNIYNSTEMNASDIYQNILKKKRSNSVPNQRQSSSSTHHHHRHSSDDDDDSIEEVDSFDENDSISYGTNDMNKNNNTKKLVKVTSYTTTNSSKTTQKNAINSLNDPNGSSKNITSTTINGHGIKDDEIRDSEMSRDSEMMMERDSIFINYNSTISSSSSSKNNRPSSTNNNNNITSLSEEQKNKYNSLHSSQSKPGTLSRMMNASNRNINTTFMKVQHFFVEPEFKDDFRPSSLSIVENNYDASNAGGGGVPVGGSSAAAINNRPFNSSISTSSKKKL